MNEFFKSKFNNEIGLNDLIRILITDSGHVLFLTMNSILTLIWYEIYTKIFSNISGSKKQNLVDMNKIFYLINVLGYLFIFI